MEFIVRILFSGLIAFVPNHDGTELNVLLLNVDHGYYLSDGTQLPHHKPLIITRAGNCSGTCPTRDEAIAQFVFSDKTLSEALDALEAATSGAWILANSDLEVRKGSSSDPDLPSLVLADGRATSNGVPLAIPTTTSEREDFTWIADLKEICGSGCTLDGDVLGSNPPPIVAARLKLRNGRVFTQSVARIGSNVTPVHFERLDGQGSASSYSQAVAKWVAADIEVAGDSIEIVETKFDGTAGRTMTLEPDANGNVEIAVLNLPPFVPPTSSGTSTPAVGKHFETYYELYDSPPSSETRMVPKPGALAGASYPEVDWQLIHPQQAVYSELLNRLRLDVGRGVYEQTLCPPGHTRP